jgi:apolipoprotein N-acyltransferase
VIRLILASIISSALYVFSFAPWSTHLPYLSFLQLIAFVPVILELDRAKFSLRKTVLAGYLVGLGITVGGFYWIIYAVQQYGGLPFSAALGVFLAFCLIAQLQVPIYFAIRKKALERISSRHWIFISGLIYAAIESTYPKLFLDTAGHAFSASLYFSQIADLGGVFFITALVITFAESIAYAIRNERRHFAIPAFLFIFGISYGAWRVHQIAPLIESQKQKSTLTVGLVQANIGDYLKIAAEQGLDNASGKVIQEYLKTSSLAIDRGKQRFGVTPDALVWPETAYSALFGKPIRTDEHLMETQLREFSSNYPGTMIFGGYDQEDQRFDYNSIFFLPNQEAKLYQKTKAYHKNILLMFGETLPFSETFPSIKSWFPTMGFFGRGPGPEVYGVRSIAGNEFKLAPSICYEGLFPYFSYEGARLGADAFLNVTNDSWFGRDGEPYLHFALTRFRTIENRLPMIRSTNTGISASIDPLGRVTDQTGLFVSDVLITQITPKLGLTTPYQLLAGVFGPSWFERFCQIIFLLLGAWFWRAPKNHRT